MHLDGLYYRLLFFKANLSDAKVFTAPGTSDNSFLLCLWRVERRFMLGVRVKMFHVKHLRLVGEKTEKGALWSLFLDT